MDIYGKWIAYVIVIFLTILITRQLTVCRSCPQNPPRPPFPVCRSCPPRPPLPVCKASPSPPCKKCPTFSGTRQHIVCVDSEEDNSTTGLEKVQFLSGISGHVGRSTCLRQPIHENESKLTSSEIESSKKCVQMYKVDSEKGAGQFWSGNTQYIRSKHHTYLNSDSIVLDIGGNVGDDAEAIIKAYGTKSYVILEPMKYLYRKLQKRFKLNDKVTIYNIGLARKNALFFVDIEGTQGDATSIFTAASDEAGSCSFRTVNASAFYTKIGLGCFEFDLITINCEGCEFEVLEQILTSGIARYFKHIQVSSHTTLKRLGDPVGRYCRIQELLKRTHHISYQYKFTWETWTRKDLSMKMFPGMNKV